MQYWLMKSEEEEYSLDDLKRDSKIHWYGVRNYQARNFMRDSMKIGDLVLFYHSNGKPSGVVGVGKVISSAYPDITQFDPKSPYYDPKATKEKPRWVLVDIGYVKHYSRIFPLPEMRLHRELESMILLQKGSRLSITPVAKQEFEYVESLLS